MSETETAKKAFGTYYTPFNPDTPHILEVHQTRPKPGTKDREIVQSRTLDWSKMPQPNRDFVTAFGLKTLASNNISKKGDQVAEADRFDHLFDLMQGYADGSIDATARQSGGRGQVNAILIEAIAEVNKISRIAAQEGFKSLSKKARGGDQASKDKIAKIKADPKIQKIMTQIQERNAKDRAALEDLDLDNLF